MKPRLLVLTFAALLPVLGAMVAACDDGGEEELSLQEYFQRFDAILNDVNAQFEALDDQFDTALDPAAPEQERLNAAQLFSDEAPAILADALAALEDLDPPSETETAHEDFLTAEANLIELFEAAVNQLADAESASELDTVLAQFQSQLIAALEPLINACLALQGIADGNNIYVDLECEE